MMMTRDEFRTGCFERDGGRCVVCVRLGVDVHHIIERRLFPDGGYVLDNGATLCGLCHFEAEQTVLSCARIREAAGITTVVLPPHFYPDEQYDKWGNILLPSGRRLPGELFGDESIQKVLGETIHLFDRRVKYPRTWHLPWSASVGPDDRVLDAATMDRWSNTDVVVTEKMDGENTTLYRDYLHARSMDYSSHVTRNWMRAYHARIAHDIPEGWRICGENLSFKHSIGYAALPSFFMVFSIWTGTRCLAWDDTLEWCALLGLTPVPVLYRGTWSEFIRNGSTAAHWLLMARAGAEGPGIINEQEPLARDVEGYVIRPAGEFTLRDFPTKVGKYVRQNHVTTHGHWMRSHFVPNHLAGAR